MSKGRRSTNNPQIAGWETERTGVSREMTQHVAHEAPPVPARPKIRWETRVQPDGTVVLPASLISPVMSAVLRWWSDARTAPEVSLNAGADGSSLRDGEDARADRLEAVRVTEFGRLYGYSERTIYNFVDLGLPSIGKGRLRRIPLREGGEWLRQHLADVAADPMDAAVEADLRSRGGA